MDFIMSAAERRELEEIRDVTFPEMTLSQFIMRALALGATVAEWDPESAREILGEPESMPLLNPELDREPSPRMPRLDGSGWL